eukprot:1157021-Pelagomonas_calceolata.AAC.2
MLNSPSHCRTQSHSVAPDAHVHATGRSTGWASKFVCMCRTCKCILTQTDALKALWDWQQVMSALRLFFSLLCSYADRECDAWVATTYALRMEI